MTIALLIVLPVSAGAAYYSLMGWPSSWRSANWQSTGTLPAVPLQDARVRLYAANTGRWKSIFAEHSWLAVKRAGEARWTRYEVVGWGPPVRRNAYAADARWYSNPPKLYYEISGQLAAQAIPKIEQAIADYQFSSRGSYVIWPGPNSNTFVAAVVRAVPELATEMPPRALGKDYVGAGLQLSPTPSKTGWQISYGGIVGAALAVDEGVELHLLGATIGIDPFGFRIKLPGVGALG